MHYTALPRMHLSRFQPGMKLLMTLYCLTVLLGLTTSVLMYARRSGFSYKEALRHYQGDEALPASDRDAFGAGGELEIHDPMSQARAIEIVHPHSFTIPLVLLVLAHLFALTNTPPAIKGACYLGSFGGFLAAFGGMWLATALAPAIYLVFAGGLSLLVTTTAMAVVPIVSMWREPVRLGSELGASRPPRDDVAGDPVGRE